MFLEGRSPNTLRAYAADLDRFGAWAGGLTRWLRMTPGEANAAVWQYKATLASEGLKSATVARRLAAVRAFSKFARMVGAIAWVCEVQGPRTETYRDTRGPGDQGWKAMVRTVNEGAAAGQPGAVRDRAIVRLLQDLALRRGEVCSLDLADLDGAQGRLAVVGKGKEQSVWMTLPGPTREAMEAWLEVRGLEPGPLFHRLDSGAPGTGRLTGESVRLIVGRLSASAGLTRRVRPHGLRHQGITRVLDKSGGDIRASQKFSRHADPKTLLVYDDNRQDLAGQMARLAAED